MTPRPRIVVVSHDHAFRHLVQVLLADLGTPVGVVETWADAAHQVRHLQPNLVILDLVPTHETEAWFTVEALRAHPATHSMTILVWPSVPWLVRGHARQLARHGVRIWPGPFQLRRFLATVAEAF